MFEQITFADINEAHRDFEEWAREIRIDIRKDERFDFPMYLDVITHQRWLAWRAAVEFYSRAIDSGGLQ